MRKGFTFLLLTIIGILILLIFLLIPSYQSVIVTEEQQVRYPDSEEAQQAYDPGQEPDEPTVTPVPIAPPPSDNSSQPENNRGPASVEFETPLPFDFYEVLLEATREISLPGTAGEMKVWIGEQGTAPALTQSMAHDTAEIVATGQQSATVNPWSNGFIFEPGKSTCFLLDRAGTTVRFSMAPNQAGTYRVGADVNLYASDDCSGTPTPREATVLEVMVTVNKQQLLKNHLAELWDITWQGVLSVWKYIVGLTAAFLAALYRKRLAALARRFGIKLPEKPFEDE